ncbi:MAG: MFS transporter [Chthonomonadales bacterium]
MSNIEAAVEEPTGLKWYQGIPRYAWIVFLLATLGWLFDAMDQNIFSLVRQPSMLEILKENGVAASVLDQTAKDVGGQITAIFLIGWAVGGLTFGVIGDRLGRTKTMIITILIYAFFTGLTGLAHTPVQYAVCRFLTALGVGGEFAAGAALIAEVWPARSRPMALGTLQALSAVGNMMAGLVTLLLAAVSWRWAYFIGAAPALLVVWIRSSVKEPEKWREARERAEANESGQIGSIPALFKDPVLRRNTIAGVLIATAGVGGLWGVGFFLPDLTGSVMKKAVVGMSKADGNTQLQAWRSQVFMVQQIGAFLGMFSYAALSERTGRRPALLLFLLLAWASVIATFWGVTSLGTAYAFAFVLGFCALAPFSAFAVYFPELFPTRLRATGVGICYNCARIIAAAAPFALGKFASHFHSDADPTYGLRVAATIVASIYAVGFVGLKLAPETRGKPLPE